MKNDQSMIFVSNIESKLLKKLRKKDEKNEKARNWKIKINLSYQCY